MVKAAKISWNDLKKELHSAGLYDAYANSIDEETVTQLTCDDCGESMYPKAFRGRGRYALYAVCLNCFSYFEV